MPENVGRPREENDMIAGIIWFAVVLYIVIRCVNSAKKKNGQTKPNVPRQPAKAKRPDHTQVNRTAAAQTTGKWTSPASQVQRKAPQQPARTAQRTGRTQQRPAGKSAQENSILQKAKANTSQQFDDDALEARGSADLYRAPSGDEIMKDKAKARHIHSEHEENHDAELRNQPGVDDFDTYHLIDEVNDLIVKGYSGNLEFERDFLSEATDMLNRMYG